MPAHVPQTTIVIITASQYGPSAWNSNMSLSLFYRPEDPNLAISAVVPVLAFPSAVSITASSLKNWVRTQVPLA